MTKLFIFLILLTAIVSIYFISAAKKSASLPSPTLVDDTLPPCSNKPNCVNSTAEPGSEHHIAALEFQSITMDDLQKVVKSTGGIIINIESNLLTAVYKSTVIGFTDDLLLQLVNGKIEVRSSSRVGYSDMNVNRKRVEQLRQLLNSANS